MVVKKILPKKKRPSLSSSPSLAISTTARTTTATTTTTRRTTQITMDHYDNTCNEQRQQQKQEVTTYDDDGNDKKQTEQQKIIQNHYNHSVSSNANSSTSSSLSSPLFLICYNNDDQRQDMEETVRTSSGCTSGGGSSSSSSTLIHKHTQNIKNDIDDHVTTNTCTNNNTNTTSSCLLLLDHDDSSRHVELPSSCSNSLTKDEDEEEEEEEVNTSFVFNDLYNDNHSRYYSGVTSSTTTTTTSTSKLSRRSSTANHHQQQQNHHQNDTQFQLPIVTNIKTSSDKNDETSTANKSIDTATIITKSSCSITKSKGTNNNNNQKKRKCLHKTKIGMILSFIGISLWFTRTWIKSPVIYNRTTYDKIRLREEFLNVRYIYRVKKKQSYNSLVEERKNNNNSNKEQQLQERKEKVKHQNHKRVKLMKNNHMRGKVSDTFTEKEEEEETKETQRTTDGEEHEEEEEEDDDDEMGKNSTETVSLPLSLPSIISSTNTTTTMLDDSTNANNNKRQSKQHSSNNYYNGKNGHSPPNKHLKLYSQLEEELFTYKLQTINTTHNEHLLNEARTKKLKSLRAIDYEKYTIRINTWKRLDQLLLSVNYHSTCEGVEQIQIIWCDTTSEPPNELINHVSNKVVIEYHTVNTLNERFNILLEPPTLGILSLDDDIMRPCMAWDSGFFTWTHSPERMVGYDPRVHVQDYGSSLWKYGSYSDTWKSSMNKYSMVLTKASFIHVDYLKLYTKYLPKDIYNEINEEFNCEDIAMSMFVSSLTNGLTPLLADFWSIQGILKLYYPPQDKISAIQGHKTTRGECVNNYSRILGLYYDMHKEDDNNNKNTDSSADKSDNKSDDDSTNNNTNCCKLQKSIVRNDKSEIFRIGDTDSTHRSHSKHSHSQKKTSGKYITDREYTLIEQTASWTMWNYRAILAPIMYDMGQDAYENGFIENTPPWHDKWKSSNKNKHNNKKNKNTDKRGEKIIKNKDSNEKKSSKDDMEDEKEEEKKERRNFPKRTKFTTMNL